MVRLSPLGYLSALYMGFALWFSGFLKNDACAREQDVSDIDILCAFQERYYASRGAYFDWRKSAQEYSNPNYPSYPNPTWPAEGNFTQAQIDTILGNHIWGYLERHTSDTYRPLFFLSDTMVDGAKSWGDFQKKIIRVPSGQSPTLVEKRRLIVECLQKMRDMVVPLTIANAKQRYAGYLYSFNGGPQNMVQAAQRYENTPWNNYSYPSEIRWNFLGTYSGGYFITRIETTKGTLTVPARCAGWQWTPVLFLSGDLGGPGHPEQANVISAVEARGFKFSSESGIKHGYFRATNRDFDPGNIFTACQNNCRLFSGGISTQFANAGSWTFSFGLVKPVFKYLPSPSDDCCVSCAPGGSNVEHGSVHISLPLGRTQLGAASAALLLKSEHVDKSLWHPGSIQGSLAPGFTSVLHADGYLKQVYGAAIVANIALRSGGDGYEVEMYHRAPGSQPDGTTGLVPVSSQDLIGTHRFINPDHGAQNPPSGWRLRYEKTHGSVTETQTFESLPPAANSSPVTSLVHPGGHKKESIVTTWAVNGSNSRINPDTETRTTYDAVGGVIAREVRTYRWSTNGRVLDSVVVDPSGAALTTSYTYLNDDPLQPTQVVRPDGSWDQYTYDGLRRVTKHRSGRLDTPLTCADAECRVVTTTWPNVMGSGITRVVTTDAYVEVARRYRQDLSDGWTDVVCTVPGAAITATTNLVTTTKWHTTGWFQRKPRLVTAPDGTLTKYTYSTSPANVHPSDADTLTTVVETGAPSVAGDAVVDGTRTTRLVNKEGNVILEMTEDIGSAAVLASRMASSVDSFGRPVTLTFHDGSQEILNYDCCGLASRTDRQGVVTNYTRDEVVSRVPAGGGAAVNGLESSTWQTVGYHDTGGTAQSGNLEHIQREEGLTSRTFRKGADGTLIETGRTVRDVAGRVLSSRDALGNVTTFAESYVVQGSGAKHLVRTTTLPDSATRIEEYAQDGSLLSLTGTAVRGQRYEYGTDASGSWTKVIVLLTNGADSAEWSQSWTDFAGRVWKTQTSAGAVTTRYFNALGQLWKTVDPDGVTALSQYDARGRLTRTILDVNRNGTVELGGPDRISETLLTLGTHGSDDVHITTTSVWDAGATPSEVAKSEVTTDGLQSWSTAAGLTSHTVRTLPAAGAWTETTTAPDNTQSVTTYVGGRLVSSARKDTAGAVLSSTSYQYDAHGRIRAVADPLGALTVYTYNDDDTVSTVTTPDPDGAGPLTPQVTSTTYTSRGQTDVVTLPDGKTSNSDYFLTGEVQQVAGTAAPAVAYTYDHAGRVRTLTTQPGTGAAAVTTWNYESASGRLQSKVHAAGSGTESYTWTAGGRALTKTNARGTVTGYFYGSAAHGTVAGAGDLTEVTYSDGLTPQITYTHDRLGRTATATRAGITRTVSLTLHGQQESEAWTGGPLDGLTVDPSFDALRRRSSLDVTGAGGTVPSVGYNYDSLTGEFASIATTGPGLTGAASASYAYRSGTRQVESVTFKNDAVTRLTQTRTYDDLHRLTGITSQNGAPLAASDYVMDDAGRRTSTVLADGTWWKYTYGDFGQVTGAERRRMAGSAPDDSDPALPGQSFTYAYDGLGNRTSTTQGGGGVTASAALTYTPAASNQYTALAHNRTGIATGSADPAATVTVNNAAAPREGPWWGESESTSAGSTAAWLNFSIDATLGGNTDHTDTSLLIPPFSLSPAYDADGNLTDDGLRTFTWDAENRLLSVTTKDTLLPAGAPMYRGHYQYDDSGRRIAQTVEARTVPNGVYVLVTRRCFLYDGWNRIAEFDYAPNGSGATRTLYRSQVWGQSLAPGGAGGLLIVRRHTGPQTGTHCATHDGNGNVTALVNAATGLESARYDYDPFGNLLQASGPFAAENPYRFSTQYTDDITGLLYYGYRHYDPVHGRWLSRDPIGEAGGVNLYGFIGNDGVNKVDVLGMFWSELIQDTVIPYWSDVFGSEAAGQAIGNFAQGGLNLISLGTAAKADRLDTAYRSGQMSGTDYASANLLLFSEGMLKAATLGAAGAGAAASGGSLWALGAEGAKGAFLFSTADVVFDRAAEDQFGLPRSRTGAEAIQYVFISTGTGYFIGVFAGGTFTILGKIDDALTSSSACFAKRTASELGPEAVALENKVNAEMAMGNVPKLNEANPATWTTSSAGGYPPLVRQPAPNILADDAIIVIGNGAKPGNFVLRPAVDTKPVAWINEPGISGSVAVDLSIETEFMRMFGRTTVRGDTLSGAFVGDVRAAGFDVVPAPTIRNPNHVRIVPFAPRSFDEIGREWLSLAFDRLARARKTQ
jgi:RHS repeat-associated protein